MTTTDPHRPSTPSPGSAAGAVGPVADWGDDRVQLSPAVSVLVGADNGRYPSGNSLLVEGQSEVALIDPSVTVVERGGAPTAIDVILNSHGHEDHLAGNGLYPGARILVHDDDVQAARSLDGLLTIYGFDEQTGAEFGQMVVEEFHYSPRPDASGFGDGDVFDLGGGVAVEALHLPGHTRGHSGFVIDDVFFLSDIDLTGFGPYYGDAWSDLDQFEASLAVAREVEARWYVTFHHKGIVDGRDAFLDLIDAFTAVIGRRHEAMLDHLTEPRSVADLAAKRFLFRPHVEGVHVEAVETRTATLHVERMLARREAEEVEPGRYRRTG